MMQRRAGAAGAQSPVDRAQADGAEARVAELEKSSNPSKASEDLRNALARQPPDADQLSLALDVARRLDVDTLLLARGEEVFIQLVKKQEAALALVKASES